MSQLPCLSRGRLAVFPLARSAPLSISCTRSALSLSRVRSAAHLLDNIRSLEAFLAHRVESEGRGREEALLCVLDQVLRQEDK